MKIWARVYFRGESKKEAASKLGLVLPHHCGACAFVIEYGNNSVQSSMHRNDCFSIPCPMLPVWSGQYSNNQGTKTTCEGIGSPYKAWATTHKTRYALEIFLGARYLYLAELKATRSKKRGFFRWIRSWFTRPTLITTKPRTQYGQMLNDMKDGFYR